MKITKTIIILTLALLIGSAAYADVSLGINGNIGTGIGSVRTGNLDDIYGSDDENLNMVPGFAVTFQITFGDGANRFFVRPEAGMLFNNGVGNGFRFTYEDETIGAANDSDCVISVSTIDVPVLLGMETKVSDLWTLDYYMGPYISIPVAGTVTSSEITSILKTASPVFGGTAGITGNLNAGPGTLVLDMRYLFDFASTKMTTETDDTISLYARRNIVLSAGYKLTF